MGLAAIQHGLLVLQFTSFNGAVNGGNEGENLISGIFCCSYGVWLVVTHPVRCVWLPKAPTAFWCSVGVCTPWLSLPSAIGPLRGRSHRLRAKPWASHAKNLGQASTKIKNLRRASNIRQASSRFLAPCSAQKQTRETHKNRATKPTKKRKWLSTKSATTLSLAEARAPA